MSKPKQWYSETARRVCIATHQGDPIEGAVILGEGLTQSCALTRPAHELEKLASWQGAKIEEVAMSDAGRLIDLGFGDFPYLIQVNEAHTQRKKRFSTAHEIGHTLMPNWVDDPQERVDAETMTWNEENEEEFLCDVVAAEILMPRREFIPRLRACGLKLESLPLLAEEFGSSLEATARGMTRAGVGDFAFITWELGWKKDQNEAAMTLSMFDEWGKPPAKYRAQKVISTGRLSNFHFPFNSSVEDDSLIIQSLDSESIVRGWQKLNVGGGKTHSFYTESQNFPLRRNGKMEQRIFMMVQLDQNGS